jgi:hypothetical protein
MYKDNRSSMGSRRAKEKHDDLVSNKNNFML